MRPASPTSHMVRPIHEKHSIAEREGNVKKYYWRKRYGSNRGISAVLRLLNTFQFDDDDFDGFVAGVDVGMEGAGGLAGSQ